MSESSSNRRLLELRDASFSHSSRRFALGPLSLFVEPNQVWGVLGPNGAGKSTLLKLMAGLLRPQSGDVDLMGRALTSWTLRQRALRVTYLPQSLASDVDMTARELVLLGRHPFRGLSFFESRDDVRAADDALRAMNAAPLVDRRVRELSGGEAQRVFLAACLAQDAPLLILDEPTASLDVRHQYDLLSCVRRHVQTRGGAAIAAIHDINLARQSCTHVLLLREGQAVASGRPEEVLLGDRLGEVFAVAFVTARSPRSRREWIVPNPPGWESRA